MTKVITADTLLRKRVGKKDRVLLVNPPVFETRYSWLRWNQPLDLLQIGAKLLSDVGCTVELFDFMQPDASGKVPKQGLAGLEKHQQVGTGEFAYSYPMWRFGKSFREFDAWLVRKRSGHADSLPTQVWITSLCSYWFRSVHQLCTFLRQRLPDAQVVLFGQYPRLNPDQAVDYSGADLIIAKPAKLIDAPPAGHLYGKHRPPFVALPLRAETAIESVREAVAAGVHHVAFFDDDICRDDAEVLTKIVEETEGLHRHLRFHAICGLHPESITPDVAGLLARKSFAELHFEQAEAGGDLDDEAYGRARSNLMQAGVDVGEGDKTSGFVWIGRPGETLEQIVRQTLSVLNAFGSVILKPYTPVPGTPIFEKHAGYLQSIPADQLSPHMFPFAERNRITREEYHDLYRMAAFLNEKVRNHSFDLLNGGLGANLLRESLRREAWKLEPSALSVIN